MMCWQILLVIASLCSYNVEMARILFKEFRLFSHSFNFAAKLIIETKYYVAFFYWEKQFCNTVPCLHQPILYEISC